MDNSILRSSYLHPFKLTIDYFMYLMDVLLGTGHPVLDVDLVLGAGDEELDLAVAEHPEPVQVDDVGQTLPGGQILINSHVV